MTSIIMDMKVFKYKFTRLTTSFIYAGLALSVVGLGINIYLLCTTDFAASANIVYPIIQHTLMFLIPVVLLVILISLLISSYYSIDGKFLKTSFGIIKSKYDIENIDTILLDRNTKKLTVYFKNENFMVIVVKEEWYDEFTEALCAANPKIEFSINSKETPDDPKDKK